MNTNLHPHIRTSAHLHLRLGMPYSYSSSAISHCPCYRQHYLRRNPSLRPFSLSLPPLHPTSPFPVFFFPNPQVSAQIAAPKTSSSSSPTHDKRHHLHRCRFRFPTFTLTLTSSFSPSVPLILSSLLQKHAKQTANFVRKPQAIAEPQAAEGRLNGKKKTAPNVMEELHKCPPKMPNPPQKKKE